MLPAYTGRLNWAKGELEAAIRNYEDAVEQAQEVGNKITELYSHLALAVLLEHQKLDGSKNHLARAKRLLSSREDYLSFGLRETCVRWWRGELEAPEAAKKLLEVAEGFEELGLVRDQAWAHLQACAALLEVSEEKARRELENLAAHCMSVRNTTMLLREWRTAPKLFALAERYQPLLVAEKPSSVIELHSLGQERVLIGGRTLHIKMRRFHEMIVYLHAHGEAGLHQILSDVFEDEPIAKARNYFHQLRHMLAKECPQLQIGFDSASKMYKLETTLPIRWDVEKVRSGRQKLDGRTFMPACGSDWVLRFSEQLEQFV